MASGAFTSSGFVHALLSSPGLLMIDYLDGRIEVHAGDCLDVIRTLRDSSIDSVVTDPPYALVSITKRWSGNGPPPAEGVYRRATQGFMGKQWDTGDTAHTVELWQEVYRVLKPGGHVLAFAGTRTYHRLACAIEDAGFEIRDQVGWVYGSGFPKSHDVSKGIDKAAGAERKVIGRYQPPNGSTWNLQNDVARSEVGAVGHSDRTASLAITAPATDAARQWQGWGTALKPAWEPICMARKPLGESTVAANVLKHGVGALNINGCRVGVELASPGHSSAGSSGDTTHSRTNGQRTSTQNIEHRVSSDQQYAGREYHPASASSYVQTGQPPQGSQGGCPSYRHSDDGHSHPGVASGQDVAPSASDEGDGRDRYDEHLRSPVNQSTTSTKAINIDAQKQGRWPANLIHDGSDEVVEAFPESAGQQGDLNGHAKARKSPNGIFGAMAAAADHPARNDSGSAARFFYHAKANKHDRMGSKHPTVKPVDLIAYLVRLVTPKRTFAFVCRTCDKPGYAAQTTADEDMRAMSRDIPAEPGRETLTEVLQCGVLNKSHGIEARKTEGENGSRLFSGVEAGQSDGEQARLCHGAPTGDGRASGPPVAQGRSSSSPERQTNGQSDRELGADAQERARPPFEAEAVAEPNVSALQGDVSGASRLVPPAHEKNCPNCGSPLERVERPGVVLDCFAGTGTTAQACHREGFRCVLIEREAEYLADIARRMAVVADEEPHVRPTTKAKQVLCDSEKPGVDQFILGI